MSTTTTITHPDGTSISTTTASGAAAPAKPTGKIVLHVRALHRGLARV
jgi:hypothetical protein